MPAIIDSAPDCVSKDPGTTESRGEDSLDFVMGDPYADCAGFMTFGPGSTYGEEGAGAETAYMLLTWIGIIVMVAVIIAWIVRENQRLIAYALGRRDPTPDAPQPGMTGSPEE
ncbi:MAG: hypothetical protein ACHQCI_02265 [Solirubrobacterales bacterium]|jgi:hypothetical protein